MRDTYTHGIYVFANVSGSLTVLGNSPRDFVSSTLYAQEWFVNIDDHIFNGNNFVTTAASNDYDFNFHGHLLFVHHINPTIGMAPSSLSLGSSTGLTPPSPASEYQRTFGRAEGYSVNGLSPYPATDYNAIQAYFGRVGYLLNARALGSWSAGAFLQTNWRFQDGVEGAGTAWDDKPRPWRATGANDVLRIEALVTQPMVFADPPNTGSPDDVSFWYFTLYLKDRIKDKGIWFNVLAFQSRVSGFSPVLTTLNNPTTNHAWLMPGETPKAAYFQAPFASSGVPWYGLCSGSATFSTSPPSTEQRFCIEINTSQMSAIAASSQAMALDAGPSFGGEFSTDPSAYDLQFFLINAEAWAPGTDSRGYGGIPATKLGFSIRDIKVQSLKDPSVTYGTWGYLEKGSTFVSGWVCDRDDYSRPVDVHFYATNATGSNCGNINGEWACNVGGATANRASEPAVANNCGGNSYHRFIWNLPSQLLTGAHKVYARALNYPAGSNTDLVYSPVIYP